MADVNLIFFILVEFVIIPLQGGSPPHANDLQFLTVALQGAGENWDFFAGRHKSLIPNYTGAVNEEWQISRSRCYQM